jgi:hypothetical protein
MMLSSGFTPPTFYTTPRDSAFPEYSEVSLRILKGLRASWTEAAWKRVIDEIDLTIAYLERR